MPITIDNRDTGDDPRPSAGDAVMGDGASTAGEYRMHEAERALAHERARFSALVRLQKDVACAGLDFPRVMRLVVKCAQELTRAEGAAVRTRLQGAMACRAACGTSEALIGDSVPLSDPLVKAVLHSGSSRCYADYQLEHADASPAVRHCNIRSLLVVPLRTDAEIGGLLVLSSSVPGAFQTGDLETAEFLAGLIATTMSRCAEAEAKQALLAERTAALTRLEESQNLHESSINAMHEGYVLRDASGKMLKCNSSAIRILEIAENGFIGQNTMPRDWRFVREDGSECPPGEHPSQIALATGIPQVNVIMGVKWPDGRLRWLSVNAAPVHRAGDLKPYATVVTFTDVTERRKDELEIARLASIVKSSQDAICSIDMDGLMVTWNPAAERTSGIPAAVAIGQHISVVSPPGFRFEIDETHERMQRGETIEPIELAQPRMDGSTQHLFFTVSPVRDAAGAVIGSSAIVRDVTPNKRQEEALRRSEARLAEAQRIANIGSWETDVRTGRTFWSDEMFRLLEFDPAGGVPGPEEVLARYYPDDLAERNRIYTDAVATGSTYQVDVRLTLPSGIRRKCHMVGVPDLDERGEVIRLAGTLMDITERDLADERFRVLFEESSDPHLLVGDEGIIDCNNAMIEMLRCADKSDLLVLHPAVLSPEFQPDGRRSAEKAVEMETIARESGFHRFEWIHCRMDGEEFHVEVTLTLVSLGGKPVILAVWHDLTERVKAEQQVKDYAIALEFQMAQLAALNAELDALATTDGLTGLTNHRKFQERLGEEVSRARRYGAALSVLMLDVDYFKQYNDAFGHPEGDEVLRQIARLLRVNARDTDTAVRYGGEEFAMILPETDSAAAMEIAERIRRAIENTAWPLRSVTASVGIACLRAGVESSGSLVSLADAAMYASKSEGRNRVTVR